MEWLRMSPTREQKKQATQRREWHGMIKATKDQKLKHKLANLLERDSTLETIAGEAQKAHAEQVKGRKRDRYWMLPLAATFGALAHYVVQLVLR